MLESLDLKNIYFQSIGKRPEVVDQKCSVKKVLLQIHKMHRKTPVPDSLFNKVAGQV